VCVAVCILQRLLRCVLQCVCCSVLVSWSSDDSCSNVLQCVLQCSVCVTVCVDVCVAVCVLQCVCCSVAVRVLQRHPQQQNEARLAHPYIWEMTHPYMWHDGRFHMCGMTHDTSVRLIWLTYLYVCHTYEWVIPHVWTSRVPRMNKSCHAYECVTSDIYPSSRTMDRWVTKYLYASMSHQL